MSTCTRPTTREPEPSLSMARTAIAMCMHTGLWSLVWFLPLDVIKMGLARLLIKVPDLAAKEHAMVMHAGFSTAFHQAGPNIVRRVSVIRIV